jgi:hypothetical protein
MSSTLGVTDALIRKFKILGMDSDEELQALLLLVKIKGRVRRGDDLVRPRSSPGYSTVLLNGFACRYKMTENGRRQIFTFQYPGDFCDFNRYVLPESDEAVAALTDCVIGLIVRRRPHHLRVVWKRSPYAGRRSARQKFRHSRQAPPDAEMRRSRLRQANDCVMASSGETG